jgi:hypothetical protein
MIFFFFPNKNHYNKKGGESLLSRSFFSIQRLDAVFRLYPRHRRASFLSRRSFNEAGHPSVFVTPGA